MKEVTRIHIAKTAYDIELPAKKQLEAYIRGLTNYTEDENVLEDIEIRITELLDKRGTKPGGVIVVDDVNAIRETLGEPEEFLGEGESTLDPAQPADAHRHQATRKGRTLFRDLDGAIVGGVVGGFARYYSVTPVWLRLGALALMFISAGLFAIVYAVMWLSIPAAKTVSDRLRALGTPATARNIRLYNEDHVGMGSIREQLRLRRRVFGVIVGIVGIGLSLVTVAATAFGAIAWGIENRTQVALEANWWAVLGLIVASGFSILIASILMSHMGFQAKATGKKVISMVVIFALGIVFLLGAAGVTLYDDWVYYQEYKSQVVTRSIPLPQGYDSATALTVQTNQVSVEYHVSKERRVEYQGYVDGERSIKQQGDRLVVSGDVAHEKLFYDDARITMYGPALETATVEAGNFAYFGQTQDIAVTVRSGATAFLKGGSYGKAIIDVKEGALFTAHEATIDHVELVQAADSSVTLGNIASLELVQPTACPSDLEAQLDLTSVAKGVFTLNGKERPAQTYAATCGRVDFSEDEHEQYGE